MPTTKRIHRAHHIGGGYGRDGIDFYPTPPGATKALLHAETFPGRIFEPACGDGTLGSILEREGYHVHASDLYDYGYGHTGIDFFSINKMPARCKSIIANPPGKAYSPTLNKKVPVEAWIEHAWNLGPTKMAMFMKFPAIAGQRRVPVLRVCNLKWVLPFIERVSCFKNGIPPAPGEKNNNNQVNWAWFIFERGYTGYPMIRWLTQL